MDDGRPPIEELYNLFLEMKRDVNWEIQIVDTHLLKEDIQEIPFPLLSIKTRKKGKAVWVIGGIHGEEPAGPIAISRSLSLLRELASKGINFVMLPICNPTGYFRNWRYLKHRENWEIGKSIGDCESFLLNEHGVPRSSEPPFEYTRKFIEKVLEIARDYPPTLVLDLHEDDPNFADPTFIGNLDEARKTYIYSQGFKGAEDPVAQRIVKILRESGQPIKMSGNSCSLLEGQIVEGIVSGVNDSSVDELLASSTIIFEKGISSGPHANSVVVVETLTEVPLEERVKIHQRILEELESFIELTQ